GIRRASRLVAAVGGAQRARGDAAVQPDRAVVCGWRTSPVASGELSVVPLEDRPVVRGHADHAASPESSSTGFGDPWSPVVASKTPATAGKHSRARDIKCKSRTKRDQLDCKLY